MHPLNDLLAPLESEAAYAARFKQPCFSALDFHPGLSNIILVPSLYLREFAFTAYLQAPEAAKSFLGPETIVAKTAVKKARLVGSSPGGCLVDL